MLNIEKTPGVSDFDPGDDGTDPHPPLDISFSVEPARVPKLKDKLAEYGRREENTRGAFQHPEVRVYTGDAQEMYKPLVLSAILDAIHEDPEAIITMAGIADTLSDIVKLDVRPAAAPYVWSDKFDNYVPDITTIVDQYESAGAKKVEILAGIGFATAYGIVSDYAIGEPRFIVPGTGTGLPK